MKFEFKEGSSFHRLVDEETGEVTDWASYRSFTYLNGYVGYTIYYSCEIDGVSTADEFCKMEGTGKINQRSHTQEHSANP